MGARRYISCTKKQFVYIVFAWLHICVIAHVLNVVNIVANISLKV